MAKTTCRSDQGSGMPCRVFLPILAEPPQRVQQLGLGLCSDQMDRGKRKVAGLLARFKDKPELSVGPFEGLSVHKLTWEQRQTQWR